MKRRWISLLLAILCVVQCAGCASLLETGITVETEHQNIGENKTESTLEPDAEISAKQEIKNWLEDIIAVHDAGGILRFPHTYSGDPQEDIYACSMDICSDTALGGYAVYYISSSIANYTDYDEAEVTITYKRTAEQVASIQKVLTMSAVQEKIQEALSRNSSTLVLQTPISTLSAEYISEYTTELYYSDPSITAFMPQVTTEIYSDVSQKKILEIEFSYPKSQSTMLRMKAEQIQVVQSLCENIQSDNDAAKSLEAVVQLASVVEYDETMEEQNENSFSLWKNACTAYGALYDGVASSEGYAMAYKMICDKLGIDCEVVIGKLGEKSHAWNIIRIDDKYYHMDVSRFETDDGQSSLYLQDKQIVEEYSWDMGKYHQCAGYLTYEQVEFMTGLSTETSPFSD